MKSHLTLTPPKTKSLGGATTIVLFVVIGINLLWLGSKIGPMYYQKTVVSKAMEQVAKNISNQSEDEAYQIFAKQLSTQDLTIPREDFQLDKTRKPYTIKVYFQKEENINKFISITGAEWISTKVKKNEE